MFGLRVVIHWRVQLSRSHEAACRQGQVGNVVNEPVAGACVGGTLSWVAEFCAATEFGHGFKEEITNNKPKGWCHATTLSRSMGCVGVGGGAGCQGDSALGLDRMHLRFGVSSAVSYSIATLKGHMERPLNL
jgi:hypothetical protein